MSAEPAPGGPELDILLSGTVFLDIIFTGLERLPDPGTEVWCCPQLPDVSVAIGRLAELGGSDG